MNVITRRIYQLELDIWEPTQKQAEKEIDVIIKAVNALTYCGHVKLVKVSEERQQ